MTERRLSNLVSTCALAVTLTLSGCAAFKHNEQPIVARNLIESPNSQKLHVSFQWRVLSSKDWHPSVINDVERKHNEIFERELINTGCCVIADSKSTPDLRLDGIIDIDDNYDSVIERLVRIPSQATLAVIPAWKQVTHKLVLSAKAGEKSQTYKLSDSQLSVQWMPMAILFVFGSDPRNVDGEIIENLDRNFIYQLKRDRFLTNAEQPK